MHETLEDLTVGETARYGSYEVTSEEIIEFGEAYDPQPFHVDEAAARESMFGELVASGWHTAAITMRIMVEEYVNESGAMGSPGVDELRWPAPVPAGSTLYVETEVLGTEIWSEKLGVARRYVETVRESGQTVLTMDAMGLYPRADTVDEEQ